MTTQQQIAAVRLPVIEARRDELLTVKEFAFMVRRDPLTIYRRIWRGEQPGAARVGGQWRIDVAIACPAIPCEQPSLGAAS